MLSESPDFVEHLKEKYGTGKKFWINYELDTEKEAREKMDAEGVDRIAERMRYFLSMLTKAAEQRHKEDPGKRLVIWAMSHYDAISPFVKKRILAQPATEYLPVNAAAGITMEATRDGKVKTQLGGQEFDVDL